jgi:hypothetical protein
MQENNTTSSVDLGNRKISELNGSVHYEQHGPSGAATLRFQGSLQLGNAATVRGARISG